MLKRSVFQSVSAIAAALDELRVGGRMSVAVDLDQDFLAAIRRIADEVAAPNADDVDRQARFPIEAIDALRSERALSALIPTEYGGGGVSFETIAAACFELGRRCGATAMVFAMHQIQIASIVRHVDGAPWFEDYLRDVARDQRLVASVTSEIGTGGDLGKSIAAVTPGEDGQATFEKQAPTVSYGAYADDLLTTLAPGARRRARRSGRRPDPPRAVHARAEGHLGPDGHARHVLARATSSGRRSRCDQVLPVPFSTVGTESMVPISHILWSHLWLGIATDAFDRARAFVRASAKGRPDQLPPTAVRLSQLMSELSLLRAEVYTGLRDFGDAVGR